MLRHRILLYLALPAAILAVGCLDDLDELDEPQEWVHETYELSCGPPEDCPDVTCEDDREIVAGPCCPECSKLEGESCGGAWGTSGTCSSWLICDADPSVWGSIGTCYSPCICTAEYRPVCGDDGRTHSNPCQAACVGAEVVHEGPCLGEEGDSCGSRGLPPCGDGLVCHGGNPPVDIPGECTALCRLVDYFGLHCRGDHFYAVGIASELVGHTVPLIVNGRQHDVRVRENGRFGTRVRDARGRWFVGTIAGCEDLFYDEIGCR